MTITRRKLCSALFALGATSLAGCAGFGEEELSENEELAVLIYGEGEYVYRTGKESLSTAFSEYEEGSLDSALETFDQAVEFLDDASAAFEEVNQVLAEEDTPLEAVDDAHERATTLSDIAAESLSAVQAAEPDGDVPIEAVETGKDEFRDGDDWVVFTPEEIETALEEL